MRSSIASNRKWMVALCVFIALLYSVIFAINAFGLELDGEPEDDPETGAGYLYSALLAPSSSDPDLKYAPYIGSGYFVCTTSSGTVYIYVPIDSKGKWGTTNNGFLCNVSSSTISGVMYDSSGNQYSFSAPGFSIPRYRTSSSYNYTDLFATVKKSNLEPATDFPVEHDFSEMYPYIFVGLMGVIILCLMRYKR